MSQEIAMEYAIECAEERKPAQSIECAIDRAFVVAHLLTGSTGRAESAVLEAIGSWRPESEGQQALLSHVLHAALRTTGGKQPDVAASCLPAQLEAIVNLPLRPRQCLVLRILIGLPRQVCAELLRLRSQRVDEYTRAAFKCLPSAGERIVGRWRWTFVL
jgi:hypothetical protein